MSKSFGVPVSFSIMAFPEYMTSRSFPSAGDLPDPGIEPASYVFPALSGGFFTTASPGKPKCILPGEIRQSEKASYYMIPSM